MAFNPAPFVKDMEKHMRHAIVQATADLLGRVARDYNLPLEEMFARYDLGPLPSPTVARQADLGQRQVGLAPTVPVARQAALVDLEPSLVALALKARASKKAIPPEMRTPCCAINAKRQPCKRFAIDGSSLCTLHRRIGATQMVKAAAPAVDKADKPPVAAQPVAAAPMTVQDDVMMHLDKVFEPEETMSVEEDSQRTVTEEEVDEDDLLNMLMTELQISA